MNDNQISDLTLRRLPKYMHFLKTLQQEGIHYTSASEIARMLDVHHTQVRKDLQLTGVRGTPKIGHKVKDLIIALEKFLSWDYPQNAFLFGVGNLGKAILRYDGFKQAGLKIIASFDVEDYQYEVQKERVKIFSIDKFPELTQIVDVKIAILCTPADVAQQVTDLLVIHGIKAIWNFTPEKLNVPDFVIVEDVNIYPSLAVLVRKLHDSEESNKK